MHGGIAESPSEQVNEATTGCVYFLPDRRFTNLDFAVATGAHWPPIAPYDARTQMSSANETSRQARTKGARRNE